MAEKTEFLQAIDDAILDADSLEQFINGSEDEAVLTRLSAEYPTIRKALKELFENGNIAGRFKTLTELQASSLTDGDYALVADDADDKNGIYIKEGGAWTKSKYNVISMITKELKETQRGYITAQNTKNINFNTITKELKFENAVYVHTPTLFAKSLATPITLLIDSNYPRRIEYNYTQNTLRAVSYLDPIVPEWVTVAVFRCDGDKVTEYSGLTSLAVDDITLGYDTKASSIPAQYVQNQLSDFIDTSKINLLSKLNWEQGKVITLGGAVQEDATWYLSGLMAVKSNEEHTIITETSSSIVYVAEYGVQGNFIRRGNLSFSLDSPSGKYKVSYTTHKSTVYIRVVARYAALSQKIAIVEGGFTADYEERVPKLKNIVIPESLIEKDVDNDYPYSLEDFVDPPKNLFDFKKSSEGVLLSNLGNLTENSTYNLSDFIPVKPSSYYSFVVQAAGDIPNISFFKENMIFKNRSFSPSSVSESDHPSLYDGMTVYVVKIPDDVHYIRLNYRPFAESYIALYEGDDEVYPRAEATPVLKNIKLSDDIANTILDGYDIEIKDKITYNNPVDTPFWITREWEGYTDINWDTKPKASYVYGIYDALMAQYPEYITKQDLGNDAFGNPIALYKFIPKRAPTSVSVKRAKVFLTCGTHGGEQVSPLATYLMLKEACERWTENPQLEVLRHNVDFLVIPVVNPSGWDKFSRKNDNGVDINRNFPEGWIKREPDSITYGGTKPLSELESQYIAQVFDENPDINIMYDFHNFHGTSSTTGFIWVTTRSIKYVQTLCQTLCSRTLNKWRQEYSWLPVDPDYQVGYSDATGGGMIADHAIGKGVKLTATFELCHKWWIDPNNSSYDATHTKTMTEALINWILLNLEALKNIE